MEGLAALKQVVLDQLLENCDGARPFWRHRRTEYDSKNWLHICPRDKVVKHVNRQQCTRCLQYVPMWIYNQKLSRLDGLEYDH